MKSELKEEVLKVFIETKDIELVKTQFKGKVYPDTIMRWCFPELNEKVKKRSKDHHEAKKNDNEYKEKRRQQSKEYRKSEKYTTAWSEHYTKTKEKRKKIAVEHRLKNIDTYRERSRINYLKNSEHYKEIGKKYYKENKEKLGRLELERYHNDPITNLKHNLRVSLNRALKHGVKKTNKALEYLGCSIQEFKVYVEQRFISGMSWEDRSLWHIDHVIPLSKLSDGYKLEQLCHYTNLQPVWKSDNLIKANSLILDVVFNRDELQKEIDELKSEAGNYNALPIYNKNVLHTQKHFYDKERQLWSDNSIKEQLIENRCFYLNKTPEQLTTREILRGFKISGMYYGYSHFSPLWFKRFIEEYNIKTVYDPCGGWGHRVLGLLGTSLKKYIYNDFDVRTCKGVKDITEFAKLQDVVEIHNKNSSIFVPTVNVDAIFTCPPYYNKETYNNKSFKDVSDFIDWWSNTVYNCILTGCKYFAYIIDDNTQGLISNVLGQYKLIQKVQVNTVKHHFTKTQSKKNTENLYVYQISE